MRCAWSKLTKTDASVHILYEISGNGRPNESMSE